MAGQPAETLIGVGLLGAGVVLVFSAVKNVSPVALVKQAVTDGVLTLDGLPKIWTPSSGVPDGGIAPPAPGALPASVDAVIDKIRAKDPALGQKISEDIAGLVLDPRLPSVAAQQAANARANVKTAFDKGYITVADRAVLEAEILKRSTK